MSAKKKTPAIETLEDLNSTIDDIAKIEVEIRRREADRDAAIHLIREDHDGQIEILKKTMKGLVAIAETYSLARRESIFGKLKSAASRLAKFGFREGNQTLCLLNKKWTWAQVALAIKDSGKIEFLRTIEEIDKDKLKTSKLTDAELAALGVRLDSKERFYVEPKTDDAERITSEAVS